MCTIHPKHNSVQASYHWPALQGKSFTIEKNSGAKIQTQIGHRPKWRLTLSDHCVFLSRRCFPEGPARHLDASRQKLTPHCLAAIFDLNYPRPNCLKKCLPNCLSPTVEEIFSSFKISPVVRVIARQLSGKNCPAAIFASRHQDASPGPLGCQRSIFPESILDIKFL